MRFNSYMWGLYKQSPEGQVALAKSAEEFFPSGDIYNSRAIELTEFVDEQAATLSLDVVEMFQDISSQNPIHSLEEAEAQYLGLVGQGVILEKDEAKEPLFWFGAEGYEEDFFNYIAPLSLGLHLAHPEYFAPYFFRSRFDVFQRICDIFDIAIPPPPGKLQKRERAQYYLSLNHSLYEFRQKHKLSAPEFRAFLYDFAPHFMASAEDGELPEPSKIWIIAAGKWDFDFLDQASWNTVREWAGHVDTRRGDVLLMYCISPRSYIHSVWRAKEDGVIDPFVHYHHMVRIGSPIKTVPVTIRKMQDHPVLAQWSLIKARFQGTSGRAVTLEQYEAILEIMRAEGQDISPLPRLQKKKGAMAVDLGNEREVEIHLLEPLLRRLGYEDQDWIRQMPLRMGRGERNYPDYAIGAVLKRGEESARMIVETKFQITTNRELEDAYFQAKSYAMRLRASIMVLAAKEGIWICPDEKGAFDLQRAIQKDWEALNHPDVLHDVSQLIGKKRLLGKTKKKG
ncbi:MAG: hypothetical protein Q8O38_06060 [Sulfurimicrobium sp.]|nr:hypothetical protein [Sulfurimicrobium sp.]